MLNKLVIGLGSNWEGELKIKAADEQLCFYFDTIRFSEPVYTEPIGIQSPNWFLNQVAIAYTRFSLEEVKATLKKIEKILGRTQEDKKRGIIAIDIDLLQWNHQVLKPDDLQREYIQKGIEAILSLYVK